VPGLRWAAGEGGLRRCQAGAGRGGPGIQGHDGLRQPARPPNWQVSGWRRPALSRSKACSAKLAVRKSPFEFPIPTGPVSPWSLPKGPPTDLRAADAPQSMLNYEASK
jgi:hypothetical protein